MEVYSDTSAVAAIRTPPKGSAGGVKVSKMAESVSTARWLDFDDIRTEIG
jgi:hypothetical protein